MCNYALDYISRVYRLGYVKADSRENPSEAGKATLAQCVSQFLTVRYEPEAITKHPHPCPRETDSRQLGRPLWKCSDQQPHSS